MLNPDEKLGTHELVLLPADSVLAYSFTLSNDRLIFWTKCRLPLPEAEKEHQTMISEDCFMVGTVV